MSVSKDLKSGEISERVEKTLELFESSRNSDKRLILFYMVHNHDLVSKIGHVAYAELRKILLKEMPSFETITRARRKIQAEGKYLASDKVKGQRAIEESEVRAHFSGE